MSDPFPLLHNPSLSMMQRIEQAFEWLRKPQDCPVPLQVQAAAKCYLLYRWMDGLLTEEQLQEVLEAPQDVAHDALQARWNMSIQTALMYVYAKKGDYLEASHYADGIHNLWVKEASFLWPPQVLNYLRSQLFLSYLFSLYGNAEKAGKIVEHAIFYWKQNMFHWDWQRWPHRPTEARDDLLCIQNLMFIARANGLTDFKDYDWVNPERMMPLPGTTNCPLYAIMRKMGELNPEKAIWKHVAI